ncbi:nuclear speckle splicing regulatory protein 1 [Schistocerca nitens]|uniref:nuclear speckle splicing regulatory protein 1 n=1 Tax=Schistocerca nitens TaxID=7011 RepID=UPI00211757E7|nr:nuclear speckle splicing regulatory protein 1 [Schistocerca nitens]
MSATTNKQYGLIVPKKPGQSGLQPRLSVFNDNSDSGDEGGDWVKRALKRDSQKSLQKKQTKLEMEKALAVDPTVYQYDEIYDKMEKKKAEEKKLKSTDKKPKYIQSLLKQAERRKKEQERRYEREVQREREAEGEQFKDKESFVTAAYRAKLEEFRKMDEQEKHMEHLEAIMDVSKQKDLSGFYRHLYRQATGESPASNSNVVKVKEEPPDPSPSSYNEEGDVKAKENSNKAIAEGDAKRMMVPTERQYRKRRASSSDREDTHTRKRTVPTSNGDKNTLESDSSSSPSDSSSDDSSDSEEISENVSNNKEKCEADKMEAVAKDSKELDTSKQGDKKVGEETVETTEPVPKCNIWEKRTVGPLFEAALERYYARKAARLAG